MNLIDKAWQTTRRQLLPSSATEEEVQAVRRVFFIGAYSLYQLHLASQELSAVDSAFMHDMLKLELGMFKASLGDAPQPTTGIREDDVPY